MKPRIVYPTENVVDIYDPNILWYKIKDFPGYEISNNGYLRSFKSAKKYPYGIILEYYHNNGNYYSMTCSNNNRYELSVDFIWDNLVDRFQTPSLGYQVETKARNSRMGIIPNKPNDNEELEKKRVKSYKAKPIMVNGKKRDYKDLSFPSFNIPDVELK